jgi:uncharacterized protein YjbI with pentapeptide repeats
MGQITVRRTSANLPVFDEDAELEPVSSLGGSVSGFQFGEASLRALNWENARLFSGRIRALRAGQASVTGVRMDSVEFTGCELSFLRWAGGKISRVRFDNCKLLGARFEGAALEHVVFTDCVLDYATLDQIRAAGPVLFVRCSLREAEFTGCNLSGALFDDCDLRLTSFGPGSYRGCDLRGNNLSALIGTGHLKHVVIDRVQLMQLAEALAAELDVTFGDDEDLAILLDCTCHRGV